jgi:hypothetical protein
MFFTAPFSGFAVGGGGGSETGSYVANPAPAGTGRNAGPARSPLRLMGQDRRPMKKRFIKAIPPGQFPALAPPYSWEPHEREDWNYVPIGDTTGRFKRPTRKIESSFFSRKYMLVELQFKRTPGVALPDPTKQQVQQLHVRAKMVRDQIAQLRAQAHQIVQAHKQKVQQGQQFGTAERFKLGVQSQQHARERDTTQRAAWRGSKVAPAIQKYKTLQQQPAVHEAENDEEPFGLEGGQRRTYMPEPDRYKIQTKPPAAYSQNPKKAVRQTGAWFQKAGKPQPASADPIGLTTNAPQRPADPQTQQLLSVHQRVAQLRQQLAAIITQIKELRSRSAPAPAQPKPVGEASWSSTRRKV